MLHSFCPGRKCKWCFARFRAKYRRDELRRTELGSSVICEDHDLLFEEAPGAYKNVDSVVNDLVAAKLVTLVAAYKPLITYKVRVDRRATRHAPAVADAHTGVVFP